VTQMMERLLNSFTTHLGAVQQREAHLHSHGSRTAARHVLESQQYITTSNDMMATFFRAHRDELAPEVTGDARPHKLTKRQEARNNDMEVNHVSTRLALMIFAEPCSPKKQIRYVVALLINKENKSKERQYAVDFVEGQHMLRHEEWPAHVPAGFIQRSVANPETGIVEPKKFYRPNLKRLDDDEV
jgi:hypothetical protein